MAETSTPTVVTDSLLATHLVIGDLKLEPLTLGVYLFLDKIGSPLLKGGKKEVTSMDMFRAVYVLTTPLSDCLAFWAQGPETFDAAVFGLCNKIQLTDLNTLGDKLLAHIQAAFATAAKTKMPESGDQLSPLASRPGPLPA